MILFTEFSFSVRVSVWVCIDAFLKQKWVHVWKEDNRKAGEWKWANHLTGFNAVSPGVVPIRISALYRFGSLFQPLLLIYPIRSTEKVNLLSACLILITTICFLLVDTGGSYTRLRVCACAYVFVCVCMCKKKNTRLLQSLKVWHLYVHLMCEIYEFYSSFSDI